MNNQEVEDSEEGYFPESDYIEIANEFAYVKVRKVRTRNGVRLEIFSPKLNYRTYLDPLELESISWTSKKELHQLLRHPWGPEYPWERIE